MSIRQEKISSLIKRELASIFQKEARNLFKGHFITVTVVRVTSDLSLAKVYISIFKVEDARDVINLLNENQWQIKKLLVKNLGNSLRKIPELRFYLDDSLDYAEEIDNLLR